MFDNQRLLNTIKSETAACFTGLKRISTITGTVIRPKDGLHKAAAVCFSRPKWKSVGNRRLSSLGISPPASDCGCRTAKCSQHASKSRPSSLRAAALGASREFRWSVLCSIPVGFPEIAIHDRAEARHAVDSADFPASTGLFQAASVQILAGTLDLATSDRAAFRKSSSIVRPASSHCFASAGPSPNTVRAVSATCSTASKISSMPSAAGR